MADYRRSLTAELAGSVEELSAEIRTRFSAEAARHRSAPGPRSRQNLCHLAFAGCSRDEGLQPPPSPRILPLIPVCLFWQHHAQSHG